MWCAPQAEACYRAPALRSGRAGSKAALQYMQSPLYRVSAGLGQYLQSGVAAKALAGFNAVLDQ